MTITEVKQQIRLMYWQQRIQEQRESRISIKAGYAQQGCAEGQFYWWLEVIGENTLKHLEEALPLVQVRSGELPETVPQTCKEVNRSPCAAEKCPLSFRRRLT